MMYIVTSVVCGSDTDVIETLSVSLCPAVQQERRPPETKAERISQAIATSIQKIYIRKDFGSPSTAVPTFSSYKVCVSSFILSSYRMA